MSSSWLATELSVNHGEEIAPLGQILVQSGHMTEDQLSVALAQQRSGDPRRVGEILVAHGAVHPEEVLDALQAQNEVVSSNLSSNNIRVDVGQLDKLMNLVGELVLARNRSFNSVRRSRTAFLNTNSA